MAAGNDVLRFNAQWHVELRILAGSGLEHIVGMSSRAWHCHEACRPGDRHAAARVQTLRTDVVFYAALKRSDN